MSSGMLSFRPYIKDTQQKVPLSQLSLHPGHVHDAWPVAETARLFRRSSSWHAYIEARNLFICKLQANYIHIDVIKKIKEWIPFKPNPRKRNQCTWVVLPFCPAVGGFQRIVDIVRLRWQHASFDLPIQVSHNMRHTRSLNTSLEEN